MFISVKADIKKLTAQLDGLARKQIPFATAQAINGIAKRAAEAEAKAMTEQLDRPTPFTQRGIGIIRARKGMPYAVLFIKDIQARYLKPEIMGGPQVLGKGGSAKAILQPIAQAVNQYGNIPKGALGRLRNRKDIFVGPVTIRGRTVSGVWQRSKAARGKAGGLKLLIRFADPKQVKTRYRWGDAVRRTVNSSIVAQEFNAAMTKALATAR